MSDPEDYTEPPSLRLLRGLVLALMVVMIVGLITLVSVFVIRFPAASAPLALPEAVTLPEGATPEAVTLGPDWVAVVAGDALHFFDRATGAPLGTVAVPGR